MVTSKTGTPVIFDIFIPSLKLAFEYQGQQHYHNHKVFGEVTPITQRDDSRRQACASLGMTLLEVPYWWQRDKESILALIKQYRPDMVLNAPK